MGSIPESGRSLGGGNGNSLQYSCLEITWTEESAGLKSMGSQKSQTQLRPSTEQMVYCTQGHHSWSCIVMGSLTTVISLSPLKIATV